MLICLAVAVEVLATLAGVPRTVLGVRVPRAEDLLPLTLLEVAFKLCALHDEAADLCTGHRIGPLTRGLGVLNIQGVHFK